MLNCDFVFDPAVTYFIIFLTKIDLYSYHLKVSNTAVSFYTFYEYSQTQVEKNKTRFGVVEDLDPNSLHSS